MQSSFAKKTNDLTIWNWNVLQRMTRCQDPFLSCNTVDWSTLKIDFVHRLTFFHSCIRWFPWWEQPNRTYWPQKYVCIASSDAGFTPMAAKVIVFVSRHDQTQHQTVHWHSKLNFFFSVIRMTEFSTLAPQMASMPSLPTLSASSGFGKVKLVGGVGYWRHKIIVGLRTCNAVGQCLNSKSQLMCEIKSGLRLQTVSVQWFSIFVWNIPHQLNSPAGLCRVWSFHMGPTGKCIIVFFIVILGKTNSHWPRD